MALTIRATAIDGSNFTLSPASITAVDNMTAAEIAASGVTQGIKVTQGGVVYYLSGTLLDFYNMLAGAAGSAGFPSSTFNGWGRARAQSNIPIGPVAYASIGTDAASVAGTIYESDIDLKIPQLATGLALLNGTVVGTDNLIVFIRDADGNLLATSALAGTLGAGADVFQAIAFTSAIFLLPGRYIIGLQVSGATHANQRASASTYILNARSTAGVFGTIPATAAALTTFAAGTGPMGYIYT